MIRDICRTVIHAGGITVEECLAAEGFLIHRKEGILAKIAASKARLPNIRGWELD
jgi:hypothetical protein